jgi:flagellar M-ring protein FliF
MYFIELGVMMLLSLVVLFMVIRPLVRRILASEVVPALPEPVMALPEPAPAPAQNLVPTNTAVDVAQVQGQLHAQTMHRVGELVERNPNETVSIVRQWMTEAAN